MKIRDLVFIELFAAHKTATTQRAIASSLGCSTGTVNHAVRPLAEIGAVKISASGLSIQEKGKFLAYWATRRNLACDISYKTHCRLAPSRMEASLPPSAILTAYGAYRKIYKEVPADYSEVYAYAADQHTLEEIKRRFPPETGPANLYVLKALPQLSGFAVGGVAPAPLVFADLWNLGTWYAAEYVKAMEARLVT